MKVAILDKDTMIDFNGMFYIVGSVTNETETFNIVSSITNNGVVRLAGVSSKDDKNTMHFKVYDEHCNISKDLFIDEFETAEYNIRTQEIINRKKCSVDGFKYVECSTELKDFFKTLVVDLRTEDSAKLRCALLVHKDLVPESRIRSHLVSLLPFIRFEFLSRCVICRVVESNYDKTIDRARAFGVRPKEYFIYEVGIGEDGKRYAIIDYIADHKGKLECIFCLDDNKLEGYKIMDNSSIKGYTRILELVRSEYHKNKENYAGILEYALNIKL